MIKIISKLIAKNFVEKNINKHKETNLGANLAHNGMSLISIITSMWQYVAILAVLSLAFIIGLPIVVSFLTTSWVLVVLSVFVALILNIVFIVKLVKRVMLQIAEEISVSLGLAQGAFDQMQNLMSNPNFGNNPETTKELKKTFEEAFKDFNLE